MNFEIKIFGLYAIVKNISSKSLQMEEFHGYYTQQRSEIQAVMLQKTDTEENVPKNGQEHRNVEQGEGLIH